MADPVTHSLDPATYQPGNLLHDHRKLLAFNHYGNLAREGKLSIDDTKRLIELIETDYALASNQIPELREPSPKKSQAMSYLMECCAGRKATGTIETTDLALTAIKLQILGDVDKLGMRLPDDANAKRAWKALRDTARYLASKSSPTTIPGRRANRAAKLYALMK